MTRQLSSSDCYGELNRRVDATAAWTASKELTFLGYSGEAIAARFRQRFVEFALPSFVLECSRCFEQTGKLPQATTVVNCNGLRMEPDGSVTISLRHFLYSLIEFSGHWMHAFLAILFSLRPYAKHDQPPIALVFGVGFESLVADGSDARFLAYCRDGPIMPLSIARRLVIQSVRPVISTEAVRVRYGLYPLFSALFWRGLRLSGWLRAIGDHVICLGSIVRFLIRWPCGIILGRDIAYHAAAAALNRLRALESVVLTNSNYPAQPLWMWAPPRREHRLHMVWYSQNSRPIVYADDASDVPLPNFRYMRLDEIWVWTDSFRQFLECLGCSATYHVVGPILWYLPEPPVARHATDDERLSIAVFDVTPVTEEVERRFGLIRNYYSEANAKQFLSDVVKIASQLEVLLGRGVEVVLKHKRVNSPIHAAGYIDFVTELADSGRLKLISPSTNLYSLIDSAVAVVVIPFSSPVHVGISQNRPSIWHDPTGLVKYDSAGDAPEVLFTHNPSELLAELTRALSADERKS